LVEHPAAAAPPKRTLGRGDALALGTDAWRVRELLGSGAFAHVYAVSLESVSAAAKVSSPANVWEWYIHTQLEARLAPEQRSRFAGAIEAHAFGDLAAADGLTRSCSVLLQERVCGPVLQQLVNARRAVGQALAEPLALFYTLDLLEAVDALHAADLLHGDLKPDNVMVRCPDPSAIDAAAPLLAPGAGWAAHGVCLIDFGRSIDLKLYPPGTAFASELVAESFECVEMRENRPWTHGADLFAVAACAHFMLHGDYIQLTHREGTWSPRLPLKRYWQTDLWRRIFETLLGAGRARPDVAGVARAIRGHFDAFPAARRGLRDALQAQHTSLRESRAL